MTTLLSLRNLVVGLRHGHQTSPIVRGVSLDVKPGERVGVVGESGSGKTLTMLSVLRLLASPPLDILEGEILLDGEDLTSASEHRLRQVRGSTIAMVYQDPMTSLNPLLHVGYQIVEALRAHDVDTPQAREKARDALRQVGLADPERVERSYPHELSGGMIQRVMIAMALAASPRLLIADEPTTALDVTIQQQILDLVLDLQETTSMAVLWVTHDLGVVARLVDRVVVMYAGRIVENAPTSELFRRPSHPYTAALLASLPGTQHTHRSLLHQIGGSPPDPTRLDRGCPFRPRCSFAVEQCAHDEPPLLVRGASRAACWREPDQWQT